MEQESFENDSTASLMNQLFVCIKVDREERPDVDKVYMAALQGMGQGGGWPMSMFLTPELKPFYGGTYFPPESRYGRIGFPELLRRIHGVWTDQNEKVLESANGITDFLRQTSAVQPGTADVDPGIIDKCFEQMQATYDPEFGGFGGGPKFPRPVVFNFLLRYFARTGNPEALRMTEETLTRMAAGGLYDHLGGGFHRYSVDEQWRVPHFEKMLYDQAQLVIACLELFQISGEPEHARVAGETLGYVMREMTGREGGFFSAEDADSPRPENPAEQGEGAFYVWTLDEVREILGGEAEPLFSAHYGALREGNALSDPQHEFTGRNILHVQGSLAATAQRFGLSESEARDRLENARAKLLSARNGRPRPHLDDKVLTAWNGLMISAFARAHQVLRKPVYLQHAERAADFVLSFLGNGPGGSLLRRFRDGEARFEAHLEDYAFLVQGLLDLYETTFDVRRLDQAVRLTEKQIELFHDANGGGFFDTSGRDSSVLVRTKEQYDGAEAAGNSITALNLLRLADMTDDDTMRALADRTFRAFSATLARQPVVMPQMVVALMYATDRTKQIVLVGDLQGVSGFLGQVHSRFIPNKIVLLSDRSREERSIGRRLAFAEGLTMVDAKPTAYLCEDYVCRLPTTDSAVFGQLLDGADRVGSALKGHTRDE
jgi:uncharacterized protein YyaL (SSP411 family)